MLGVASALYDDVTGWPKLTHALRRALLGDGTLLLDLSDEYSGRRKNGNYFSNENDISPIITCLDWNSFETYPSYANLKNCQVKLQFSAHTWLIARMSVVTYFQSKI